MSSPRFKLRLYVNRRNSSRSLAKLYKALEFHAYDDYELKIVNVDEAAAAELAQVRSQDTPLLALVKDDGNSIVSGDLDDPVLLRKTFGFNSRRAK